MIVYSLPKITGRMQLLGKAGWEYPITKWELAGTEALRHPRAKEQQVPPASPRSRVGMTKL
jgi:hypothetical protein